MDFDLNVSLGSDDGLFEHRREEYCLDVENSSEDVDGITDAPPPQNARPLNYDPVTICSNLEKKLAVGSVVPDENIAYWLYCEYANSKGFSVRKGEQRYIDDSKDQLRWKSFLCYCAGVPDGKSSKGSKNRKMIRRCECKAKLKVYRSDGGSWIVTVFDVDHNHTLVPPDQTYLLRSSRNLCEARKAVLEALQTVGMGVSRACAFMEDECGGPQNLGFIREDAYAHMRALKRFTKLENGDASALHDLFTNKSIEEPCFYYKVQLDDDGRLMNFFFRDSRCMDDYEAFGDVLSVDTTYRTNRYHLICAPFVGINHHRNNVMFGMAFLSDETTGTFEWLFRAFLESMNGKEPKVVFTDQCQALMRAIDSCFPNSKHRLCQWHVNRNAPSHFGSLKSDSAFKKMWYKCMKHVETEDEFEEVWRHMINGFNLTENRWFKGMYRLKKRWASVFTNSVFSAGLLATSRSEVTNKVLKEISAASVSLYEFVRNYEKMQRKWREKERNEDTYNIWVPGQLLKDNPLLKHAATVYTRSVFKEFQTELLDSFNVEVSLEECVDLGDDNMEFKTMCAAGKERSRTVVLNSNTHHATCSCHMFETDGLLCRHILRLYNIKSVRALPEDYVLKRWSKNAKRNSLVPAKVAEEGNELPYIIYSSQMMRGFYNLISSTKDNAEAREYLSNRFDAFRDEMAAKFSLDGVELRSGLKSVNTPPKMKDPKSLRERGFINARKPCHWDKVSPKGKQVAAGEKALRVSKKKGSPSKRRCLDNMDAQNTLSNEVPNSTQAMHDTHHHFYFSQP